MSRRTACSSAAPHCFSVLRVIFMVMPRLLFGASGLVRRREDGRPGDARRLAIGPAGGDGSCVTTGHSCAPVSMLIMLAPMRTATPSAKMRSMIGMVAPGPACRWRPSRRRAFRAPARAPERRDSRPCCEAPARPRRWRRPARGLRPASSATWRTSNLPIRSAYSLSERVSSSPLASRRSVSSAISAARYARLVAAVLRVHGLHGTGFVLGRLVLADQLGERLPNFRLAPRDFHGFQHVKAPLWLCAMPGARVRRAAQAPLRFWFSARDTSRKATEDWRDRTPARGASAPA